MAVDPVTRERVLQMYQAQRPIREIVDATGVARGTIYFLIKSEGITPARYSGRSRVSDDRIDALERRVRELERTLARVAKAYRPTP